MRHVPSQCSTAKIKKIGFQQVAQVEKQLRTEDMNLKIVLLDIL